MFPDFKVNGSLGWTRATSQDYQTPEAEGRTVRWLIGPQEKKAHLATRYSGMEPGGTTSLDRHRHDHGITIIKGSGHVFLGNDEVEVSFGDVVCVPPRELHQFESVGREPLRFLCVIPARGEGE